MLHPLNYLFRCIFLFLWLYLIQYFPPIVISVNSVKIPRFIALYYHLCLYITVVQVNGVSIKNNYFILSIVFMLFSLTALIKRRIQMYELSLTVTHIIVILYEKRCILSFFHIIIFSQMPKAGVAIQIAMT